ncbi:DUF397 domain-containing protein [Streptomyces sp. NPDC002763]|uniref:DUF397 domain-containing protein n=1 Tax=Streptomyces sp. NPDC002763 TaxID=3154427 RepID=UPI00331D7043
MNTAASLAWFKSSYTSNEGGNCIEVAYHWGKSSYGGSQGGDCVEVASHTSAVHVRDSKTPDGPMLTLFPSTWSDFLERLAR